MERQKPTRRGPRPRPGTQDELVAAGVRLFHERGFAATGIQDVVDAAGVPKGSFYNHFDSKESFGERVLDAFVERGGDARAVLAGAGRPVERLRTYFDARIRALAKDGFTRGCLLGNFSLELADHSEAIRARLRSHFASWSGALETCLAEAKAQGAIRSALPPRALADFILDSWEGALMRMRVEKSDAPLRRFQQVVFDALLAGE